MLIPPDAYFRASDHASSWSQLWLLQRHACPQAISVVIACFQQLCQNEFDAICESKSRCSAGRPACKSLQASDKCARLSLMHFLRLSPHCSRGMFGCKLPLSLHASCKCARLSSMQCLGLNVHCSGNLFGCKPALSVHAIYKCAWLSSMQFLGLNFGCSKGMFACKPLHASWKCVRLSSMQFLGLNFHCSKACLAASQRCHCLLSTNAPCAIQCDF